MSGGGSSTNRIAAGSTPSSFISLRMTRCWLLYLLGIANTCPARSFSDLAGRSLRTMTVDPSRCPRYAIRTLTPCSRSFIASGAIMKVASSRPPLSVSTTVGKSVKRCDSKRVERLVFDAKSVTGHVRWQVTGRNPTASVSRSLSGGLPGRRDRRSLPRLQPQHGEERDEGQGARRPSVRTATSIALMSGLLSGFDVRFKAKPGENPMHRVHDLGMRRIARPRHGEQNFVAHPRRPLGQDQHAIRELRGFLDVMGDQNDRARLLAQDPRQFAPHLQPRQVVERRERLVHQQQRRVAAERARQLDALPHAARQLMGIAARRTR